MELEQTDFDKTLDTIEKNVERAIKAAVKFSCTDTGVDDYDKGNHLKVLGILGQLIVVKKALQ